MIFSKVMLLVALQANAVAAFRGGAKTVPLSAEPSLPVDFDERSLQDVETIVIGSNTQTVSVTVDQTAANGLVSYGGKYLALTPFQCGRELQVSCTATMNSNLVNMQFFLRKALRPDADSNGNAQNADCSANGDTDLISPDKESCSVTNFQDCPTSDLVAGYVAVTDSGLNLGATYTINFVCEAIDPPGGGCFSKDSTVTVLGKGKVFMKDLQVGDKVLTGAKYEPVYAFAHLDKTKTSDFLQIHTSEGQQDPLEVTKDHLLLVNETYVPAEAVQVGDTLPTGTVTKITNQAKTGLYAPLTPSGYLLVNGVHVSTYVALQKDQLLGTGFIGDRIDTGLSYHFINHIALSPIRLACLGVSSQFCKVEHIREETGGYAPFVSFWFQLTEFFQGQWLPVQLMLMMTFFGVVGPLYVMETIFFGASLAPTIVLGLAVLLACSNKKTKNTDSDVSMKVKQI